MPTRLPAPVALVFVAAAVLLVVAPGPAVRAAPTAEGGEVTPAEVVLKTQKPPDYPPAAKAARIGGTVTLEIHVNKDGSVGDVEILECTHPKVGFEDAAKRAVKKWEFVPANFSGEPLESSLKYRLSFNYGPGGRTTVSSGIGDPDAEPDSAVRTVNTTSPTITPRPK